MIEKYNIHFLEDQLISRKHNFLLPNTLLIAEILSGKNVRAWVSMDFTQDKFSAPIAIEKIKILGAPWELLAKQHCQSSPFTSNLGQIGQIGSAV